MEQFEQEWDILRSGGKVDPELERERAAQDRDAEPDPDDAQHRDEDEAGGS